MKILVTGITGTVGSEVLRQAILDKDIEEVIALGRSAPEMVHPKIKFVEHKNFLDYTGLENTFRNVDACLWCLGISQLQVTKEQLHIITYDYTIAAAKAMIAANASITFMFLSGEGADPSGKSKTAFAKEKGATENALSEMPFKHLYIARPGGIQAIHRHNKMPFAYKIMIPFYPVIKLLAPSVMIDSVMLAKALLKIVKDGGDKTLYENVELREVAKGL